MAEVVGVAQLVAVAGRVVMVEMVEGAKMMSGGGGRDCKGLLLAVQQLGFQLYQASF